MFLIFLLTFIAVVILVTLLLPDRQFQFVRQVLLWPVVLFIGLRRVLVAFFRRPFGWGIAAGLGLMAASHALAQTWLPGTNYPGLNPEAGVVLDLGLVLVSGWLAHLLTGVMKARGNTRGATTQGVAIALSALINGGFQLVISHGFTFAAVLNWLLGSVFTWLVADGFYLTGVQRVAAGTAAANLKLTDKAQSETKNVA